MQNEFSRTRLLLDAEARGIACTNGLYMLVAQAVASEEIWQQKKMESGKPICGMRWQRCEAHIWRYPFTI